MADTRIVVTADTRQAERALGNLQDTLKGIASVVIGGDIIRQLGAMAIEAQVLTNKLKLVSGSTEATNANMAVLAETAKRTGSNLGATVDLFTKLAASSTFAGSSTQALAGIVENFNKTLQISGADGQSAAAAIYQFSQAMQKGTLNGDEFRTITETNGYLLRVLQKELNVSATELRQMASDGKLSAEIVGKALSESAMIAKDYANVVRTLPQAYENLKTSLTVAIGRLDDMLGISRSLAAGLDFLANNVGILVGAIGGLSAALLVLAARSALVTAVLVRSGWGAAIVGVGAAVGYIAEKMGLLGLNTKDTADAQASLNGQISNGLVLNHQRNQQALDLDKTLKQQIESMKVSAQFDGQMNGLNNVQLTIQKEIALERVKYQKTGEKILPALEKELAIAVAARENAQLAQQGRQLILENLSAQAKVQQDLLIKYNQIDAAVKLGASSVEGATAKQRLHLQSLKDIATIAEKDPTKTMFERYQARLTVIRLELEMANKQAAQLFTGGAINLPAGAPLGGGQKVGDTINPTADRYKLILEGDVNYNLEAIRLQQELYNEKLGIAEQYYAALLQQDRNFLGQQTFSNEQAKAIARERTEFEKKTTLEKTQFGIEQGAMMFSALGAQNKKAFEAAKALNIASAIMNTYAAVTKSLAAYPWPFSMVAAGAALAMGLAQVAQIKAQNYSGRALGGPVMGNNPYIVGESGPELFVPQGTGSIVRNGDLGGSGGATINFNIQANDSQGFDDLLVQRRGMITQFVRDAMQENGQRSRM